jgi:hypothetical protein
MRPVLPWARLSPSEALEPEVTGTTMGRYREIL